MVLGNKTVNWTAIRTLAPDRFDAFQRPGDADELDAICRYSWNMAVCCSLQANLHILEVTFRNKVHNALSVIHTDRWFENPRLMTLSEQSAVIRAKQSLHRMKRPEDTGRIVAELNFGFWTGLFGKEHEHDIIRPTIRTVFPFTFFISSPRTITNLPKADFTSSS